MSIMLQQASQKSKTQRPLTVLSGALSAILFDILHTVKISTRRSHCLPDPRNHVKMDVYGFICVVEGV